MYVTDEELDARCFKKLKLPQEAYLPFGWGVAALAEQAKAGAVAQNATQALLQLWVSMLFLTVGAK